jgi:hypothetical protein
MAPAVTFLTRNQEVGGLNLSGTLPILNNIVSDFCQFLQQMSG